MTTFIEGWQPTSFNPNILTGLNERSAEDYQKRFSPYDERWNDNPDAPKPSVDFARQFETGYNQVLDVLSKCDPKGKIIKAFKGAPIAPKMILERSQSQPDILEASKFGGIPDLRRDLESSVQHYEYMAKERNKPMPSLVEIFQKLWPKDANGEYMMFVAQLIFTPAILNPWNYFTGQQVSQYDTYYPLAGFERGHITNNWTRGFYIFRSASAPFFDPRLDCAMIQDQWFDNSDITPLPTMSKEEYLALVAEAIPQVCQTHFDDSVRWSHECQTVTDIHVGFDLDIPSPHEWAGVPDFGYTFMNKLDDMMDEIEVCYRDAVTLFGAPRSQQTPKRFMSTNAYMRPRAMYPWLHFNDDHHDYTWQFYFCNIDHHERHTWGKIDGSCT